MAEIVPIRRKTLSNQSINIMGKDNNLVEIQIFSREFHLPKRRSIYAGFGTPPPSLPLSLPSGSATDNVHKLEEICCTYNFIIVIAYVHTLCVKGELLYFDVYFFL